MRRKIWFLWILWLWNCTGITGSFPGEASYMDRFRQSALDEINLVRQTPLRYIDLRLGDKLQEHSKCKKPEEYPDRGLEEDLRNNYAPRAPIGLLTLDYRLNRTAQNYAELLHRNNEFGHNINGSLLDRCRAEGYQSGCGENLALSRGKKGYNEIYWDAQIDPQRSAKNFVLQLLLDCGYKNLDHRKNMLDDLYSRGRRVRYTHVGIGYYQGLDTRYNDIMKHIHVQNFGSNLP